MRVSIYNNVTGELLFKTDHPTCDANTIAEELGFDKDFVYIEVTNSIVLDIIDDVKTEKQNMYAIPENEPKHIGDIDEPISGSLIYVPSYKSLFKTIIGGVGTISEIIKKDDNFMVEVLEVPGTMFNWNEIKSLQKELSEQFGFNSSCIIK